MRPQETEHSVAVNCTNSNTSFSHQQDHPPIVYLSLYVHTTCLLIFGTLNCYQTAVSFGTTAGMAVVVSRNID